MDKKKLFVKSYGCQMNVYDSTRMIDTLVEAGYEESPTEQTADLIILNTCHIREKASEKIFSELGKLRIYKEQRLKDGLETKIAVAGCVAQAEGGQIIKREKSVDLVIGPQNYHRLPDLLTRLENEPALVDTEFPIEEKFDFLPPPQTEKTKLRGITAFVTIQEGCDKFCAFCVVPYTRGAESSRPVEKIIEEITNLAESGVREVTLLGQNVNAYCGLNRLNESVSLAGLIVLVSKIPGILRIRYMTSHPNDMQPDLIAAHATQPALMPFLHLPVQSGSDRILAAMNRKHKAEDYIELVKTIRKANPDIALSSDFIIGFPGETEADFEATLDLIRQVGFASSYYFKYSPRIGTPGAELTDKIPESVMQNRFSRLQDLVEQQRRDFNRSMHGKIIEVLVEKKGKYEGQVIGKSAYMQPVHVKASYDRIGQLIRVEITDISTNSLFGDLIEIVAT
jgi:tRNA-2-methylthio-N6-dimethylallyladenosine synthase